MTAARPFLRLQAFLLAILVASSCAPSDTAPVVADVSLELSRTAAAFGSPIDLTYRFDVRDGVEVPAGFRVFAHVVDAEGQRMWNDDHDPPIPTESWTPGVPIQYTRTIFIPVVPPLGEATVRVGLHRGAERLRLEGPDPVDNASPDRDYAVATLELLPQAENILLISQGGWHTPEFVSDDPSVEWEWTERVAVLSFRNPRQDVTFFLEFDARPEVFGDSPQQVTVWVGEEAVSRFAADQATRVLRRIPITASQLGDGDAVELRVEVDRTFVPAQLEGGGSDSRELGIRVYHAHVETR